MLPGNQAWPLHFLLVQRLSEVGSCGHGQGKHHLGEFTVCSDLTLSPLTLYWNPSGQGPEMQLDGGPVGSAQHC